MTDMSTSPERRKKILEQIAKLQRIANPDSNAFQGEINNATRMIMELMDKYNISEVDVHEANIEAEKKEVEEQFKPYKAEQLIKGIKQWHWSLAHIIERVTHTKAYQKAYRNNGHLYFFGSDTNAQIAAALFADWVGIIEDMSLKAVRQYAREMEKKYDYATWEAGKRKAVAEGEGEYYPKFQDTIPYRERTTYFKPNWLSGCVAGMLEVVVEKERARDTHAKHALMVVDQNMMVRYKQFAVGFGTVNLKQARGSSLVGYERGQQVGRSIDITSSRVSTGNGTTNTSGQKLLGG